MRRTPLKRSNSTTTVPEPPNNSVINSKSTLLSQTSLFSQPQPSNKTTFEDIFDNKVNKSDRDLRLEARNETKKMDEVVKTLDGLKNKVNSIQSETDGGGVIFRLSRSFKENWVKILLNLLNFLNSFLSEKSGIRKKCAENCQHICEVLRWKFTAV